MHIERTHKMAEKLTECACAQLEKGIDHVDTCELERLLT
mgnify:FL=1